MRVGAGVMTVFVTFFLAAISWGRAKEREAAPPPATFGGTPVNVPAVILDIASGRDGSLPGGATVVRGQWTVDRKAGTLNAAAEPLLDSWLEFGPEIREKGAVIVVSGRAPGKGRLQSRFGAGLYGKNGFQLRLVSATQKLELVRRGVVLHREAFAHRGEDLCHLELSVKADRHHWIVSGRAWKNEDERPGEAAFRYKIFAGELLFPLAGRSLLFATPFSGEPVSFSSAKVYDKTLLEDTGVEE
jgi:hypothetical protein